MAFSPSLSIPIPPLTLAITISFSISVFFISPVHSVKCATQKLPENRTYANCTDLHSLEATLHFTYNATNQSLAVAFTATPSKPDGWVAWGINPSGGGMVGAGALIAFKHNSKITVNTYNLTSYKAITQSNKLAFKVSDSAAVESGGVITIFAVVDTSTAGNNISQVWQVGPSVTNGVPDKHDFGKENLSAKMALQVAGTVALAPSPSGRESGSGGGGNTTANGEKSGGDMGMGERLGLGFYLGLFLVVVGFMRM